MGLVLILAAALLCATPAFACSCLQPGSPKAELENADAVFLGTVSAVEPLAGGPFPRLEVTLRLLAVWKGVPEGEEVTLGTAADGAACGYGFEMGKTYVVYAYGGDEGEELTTSLCTRNASKDEATEDLAALGEPLRRVEAPKGR
jgi:hypothetical protein